MRTTRHFEERMEERGVSREMVEFVLDHGNPEKDRVVLGRKDAEVILQDLERPGRVAKRILGRGGLVVVASGDALITTYTHPRGAGRR